MLEKERHFKHIYVQKNPKTFEVTHVAQLGKPQSLGGQPFCMT